MLRGQVKPTTNIHLSQKWDMIEFETHRYNVRHMKSRIDQIAPETFMHIYIKPRKLQTEMERIATIQRNNRFLLERINTIQKKGGWIDNKNFHEIKSRNSVNRQKDMMNLAFNNKIMLERIRNTHTCYNRSKLEDGYEIQKKYKALSLKYPPNWREIRDKILAEREEIRKKYVYPRVGFCSKKYMRENKGIGDMKEEDLEASDGDRIKLSNTPRKEKINYKKPIHIKKEAFSGKGESRLPEKKRMHKGGMKRDPRKGDTNLKSFEKPKLDQMPRNIETSDATDNEKISSDQKNINVSSINMDAESEVTEKAHNGHDLESETERNEALESREKDLHQEEEEGKE